MHLLQHLLQACHARGKRLKHFGFGPHVAKQSSKGLLMVVRRG